MKIFNPNIPPADGYWFQNQDGARIVGNGWKNLERRVIEYRKRNGGSLENVEEEIIDQFCRRHPSACREGGAPKPRINGVKNNLKARLLNWLGTMAQEAGKGKLRRVPEAESKRRAQTCMGCPLRKDVDVGCTSCNASIKKLRGVCLDGREPVSTNLGSCEALGNDLATAAGLEEPAVNDPKLPDHCWRKQK